MFPELINNLILIIGGIFATAISSIIVYHYTKKADCFRVQKEMLYSSRKDIDIIKRFLAIQSRMIDESVRINHPEDVLKLEVLAKEMFEDK